MKYLLAQSLVLFLEKSTPSLNLDFFKIRGWMLFSSIYTYFRLGWVCPVGLEKRLGYGPVKLEPPAGAIIRKIRLRFDLARRVRKSC